MESLYDEILSQPYYYVYSVSGFKLVKIKVLFSIRLPGPRLM